MSDDELSRRRMLGRVALGLGGLVGAALAVPGLGFLLAPLFERYPRKWRRVGTVDEFPVGSTTAVRFIDASPLPWAGVTARTAAWLRRDAADRFVAFSVNCTHLGCPVRWLEGADLFMCPCHGGVYYRSGKVAAGPPPRPLPRYEARIREGYVEILTGPVPITT